MPSNSSNPTTTPSQNPSPSPSTVSPSDFTSFAPSSTPTKSSNPTANPSSSPSSSPSTASPPELPSSAPLSTPTKLSYPTSTPPSSPSALPSKSPIISFLLSRTFAPSHYPSVSPTVSPTISMSPTPRPTQRLFKFRNILSGLSRQVRSCSEGSVVDFEINATGGNKRARHFWLHPNGKIKSTHCPGYFMEMVYSSGECNGRTSVILATEKVSSEEQESVFVDAPSGTEPYFNNVKSFRNKVCAEEDYRLVAWRPAQLLKLDPRDNGGLPWFTRWQVLGQ